jgi:hypothetical protein
MMHRNENYVNGWPHGSGIWAQQNRVNDMMYPFRHLV